MEWNTLEQDALAELFNLGLGRAAASLGKMTKHAIDLHTPTIKISNPNHILETLGLAEESDLFVIKMAFDGVIFGDSFLVFEKNNCEKLTEKIMGEPLPEDQKEALTRDTLGEVGNIVLNACLSSFCDTLSFSLETGIPIPLSERAGDFQILLNTPEDKLGIVAEVSFYLAEEDTKGMIVFFMESGSINTLRGKISNFVRNITQAN